ncbi:MAG: enoyl-CoA hydratase/isomerase family protein [Gammaproteobacteria bacterium]
MIHLNIDAPVATVTLDYSPVNALNGAWVECLDGLLDQVTTQRDIAVLHLRSALKVFCAGADLGLMRRLLVNPGGRDEMIEIVRGLQRLLSRLESSSIVTVAEIGGAALGGGLELALACDLRVVAETAKLGLPEAGLGLTPGAGGTQRLPRICGEAVARRLIFGAEIIDGKEAVKLRLAQWSLPAEKLAPWTRALVQRISSLPARTLAACKRCINATLDDSINGYELELTETRRLHDAAETQQLVQAFLERSS